MKYERDASRHIWRASTSKIVIPSLIVSALGALLALGSMELVGVSCDRAQDRCELVNVTLLGGKSQRTFAPSKVEGVSANTSRTGSSFRGMQQAIFEEAPQVRLQGGELVALRVTKSSKKLSSSMWPALYSFLERGQGASLKQREVFAGWGAPIGLVVSVVMSLVVVLAGSWARLELDVERRRFSFARRGIFSPARQEGRVDEVLEACVVQPDPNTSSPGTFLLTRQGRWLALELRTSFIGTSEFDALKLALEQVGVPLRPSAPAGPHPKIDYGRVPLVLGLWVMAWVAVCGVVAMVGALLIA